MGVKEARRSPSRGLEEKRQRKVGSHWQEVQGFREDLVFVRLEELDQPDHGNMLMGGNQERGGWEPAQLTLPTPAPPCAQCPHPTPLLSVFPTCDLVVELSACGRKVGDSSW